MRYMNLRVLLWAMLLTVFLPSPVCAQTSINGAGATFPYPMYSKWFNEYRKVRSDVQINYQSIGSGGGLRQVTEGTVDFGATDGPMNDEQIALFKQQRGTMVLHFPTVLGADVPAYNLPGVTAELNFTPEALAGIFSGTSGSGMTPRLQNLIRTLSFQTRTSSWFTARTVVVLPTCGQNTCARSVRNGTTVSAKVHRSNGR